MSMLPSLNVMVSLLVISMKVKPWVLLVCGLLFGRTLISILVHVGGQWRCIFEGKWTSGCCRAILARKMRLWRYCAWVMWGSVCLPHLELLEGCDAII